jgi:plastocyanin
MPTASGVATSVPATPAPVVPTATPVPAPAAPASFSVQIVQPSTTASTWGYSPSTVTIHVGDTVTWTNAGPLAHTVTADDGSFDSGSLNVGDTWSMTFQTAGTFTYYCTPHPWMKGTVIVKS